MSQPAELWPLRAMVRILLKQKPLTPGERIRLARAIAPYEREAFLEALKSLLGPKGLSRPLGEGEEEKALLQAVGLSQLEGSQTLEDLALLWEAWRERLGEETDLYLARALRIWNL